VKPATIFNIATHLQGVRAALGQETSLSAGFNFWRTPAATSACLPARYRPDQVWHIRVAGKVSGLQADNVLRAGLGASQKTLELERSASLRKNFPTPVSSESILDRSRGRCLVVPCNIRKNPELVRRLD